MLDVMDPFYVVMLYLFLGIGIGFFGAWLYARYIY